MATWAVLYLLAFTAAGTTLVPEGTARPSPNDVSAAVFDLNEVPVFDIEDTGERDYFCGGQSVECTGDPCNVVSAYPAFASKQPLYGSVRLPRQDHLDRSGPQYCFALDESKGTGTGYDVLYFDANCNRDLTDDPPLVSRPPWPTNSMLDGDRFDEIKEQAIFPFLKIRLEGSPSAVPALELMPRLAIRESGYKSLSLVTTKVHVGDIEIAGHKYTAHLGHARFVSGWFDRPDTTLTLVPKDPAGRLPSFYAQPSLACMHLIGDRYWQFSATPAGDRLTVKPCPKPLGTIEIGPGGRRLQGLTFRGALRSRDGLVVLDQWLPKGGWEPARSRQIPEGDYQPYVVTIQYGALRVWIVPNVVRDGTGDQVFRSDTYGIQIRKDRPFVLDFSGKPEVLFASPGPSARVKRGQTLKVQAWLVDPRLGVLIEDLRSLPHTRLSWIYTLLAPGLLIAGLTWLAVPKVPRDLRPIGWVPITASLLILAMLGFNELVNTWMAKTYTPVPKKLAAGAVVTRANGEVVSRGDFPVLWRIPKDLELKGDEEVFTIKATFETEELYGTVKATRQVTVCR
jgi:hypothetical protein